MVFSSIPAYLDPANWQQQPNHQNRSNATATSSRLLQLPPPPPPLETDSVRPGSMADRARMANLPMPEGPLKCPRCDSTNTKFCYFNNYSLSQPRHFCKTCRRYWTRGGALRSVPVGGGCRRNRRSSSKASSSKSHTITSNTSSINTNSCINSNITDNTIMQGLNPQVPPLSFMAPPLQNFTEYSESMMMGLNCGGFTYQPSSVIGDGNFLLGNNNFSSSDGSAALEQLRLTNRQQLFPASMDPHHPLGLFSTEGLSSGFEIGGTSRFRSSSSKITASGLTQFVPVKTEENQEMDLSRQFLGLPGSDQYYWGGGNGGWSTDLSGFTSSSGSQAL